MYIFSKFAIALISPLGASLFLGMMALLFAGLARRRLAVLLGVMAVGWLGLWSLPVASDWLRASLEDQFPPVAVEVLPKAEAIVVLGGGVTPPAVGRRVPDLSDRADRVWHGVRLFHAGKAPLVLLSGGSDPAFSAMTEAQAMRQVMLALGVPDKAMALEGQSRNTSQNAGFSAVMLADRGIERILLVTSALHMPRAVARFEEAGLTVIAAATDHVVMPEPVWRAWLPRTDALDGSARAMKEWVGVWVGR
jgi:uncharacterized SAM-binding protein YcdF (DUF218 family)